MNVYSTSLNVSHLSNSLDKLFHEIYNYFIERPNFAVLGMGNMDNYGNVCGKTLILANTYQKINDEGRDLLDRLLQKLLESGENSTTSGFMRVAFSGVAACDLAKGR